MKKAILLGLILFSLSFISAMNIDIEKTSSDEVLIIDLDKPVIFDLKITNNEMGGNFEFYNIVGFEMSPEKVFIKQGETKDLKIGLSPIGEIKERGGYTIPYYIKASESDQEQKTLTFKIIDLKDAFLISVSDLDPESTYAIVSVGNKEKFTFEKINAKFLSPFFELEKEFSLGPKETKTFSVEIDKEKSKNLIAGFYTMTTEVSVDNTNTKIESVVKFIEKDIITTIKNEFGLFVNTQIIEKANDGNVIQKTETVVRKNMIPRLFTSLSPEPDFVEREGTTVYYTWVNEIKPGETAQILVKTNWLFPVIIVFFLVAIVIITKQYTKTDLILKKKITFVRSKGGEFALKVSVLVNSKRYLERVNVVDRLPPLVDVYDRFGGDTPSKIDRNNKRLEWNFEKLDAGETRVLSYVIYSKVGVLGRFALPAATAIYEKNGSIHESESNRTFFVAEQRARKED